MSSKTQLNDYTKRLKREISDLKREKADLIINRTELILKTGNLIKELKKSRLKERKWYHFF